MDRDERPEGRDSELYSQFLMQVSFGRLLFTTNDLATGMSILDYFSINDDRETTSTRQGLNPERISSFRCWKVRHTSYHHELEQALPDTWVIKRNRPKTNYPIIEEPCSICLCEIKTGQVVRELPCKHTFHQKCIDKWLHQSSVCPIDRRSLSE